MRTQEIHRMAALLCYIMLFQCKIVPNMPHLPVLNFDRLQQNWTVGRPGNEASQDLPADYMHGSLCYNVRTPSQRPGRAYYLCRGAPGHGDEL